MVAGAGTGELDSDVLVPVGGTERSGGWRWDAPGIVHLDPDSIPEACSDVAEVFLRQSISGFAPGCVVRTPNTRHG